MTKTCNIISFIAVLCVLAPAAWCQNYSIVKGSNRFEVKETKNEYEVLCSRGESGIISKNKNILDRQLRMDAVDLIGAYILFKNQSELPPELFPVFVEGINYHYEAYLEGLSQSERTVKGKTVICYSCLKGNYKIESASYNAGMTIPDMLLSHYNRDKGEASAALLYGYDNLTSVNYINLEHDYLSGDTQLPSGIRVLQGIADRFESTVFEFNNLELQTALQGIKESEPKQNPYRQFYYEEYLTAAPLKTKDGLYRQWRKCISEPHCIWEDFLRFAADKAATPLSSGPVSFSDVIAAFPGAVSPFGIRTPLNDNSYNSATVLYSESQFEKAALLLKESIDNEGISPKSLNLIGASYRLIGKPEQGLPYLLLCIKLDPKTPFLVGNIVLSAAGLGYEKTDQLAKELSQFAIDKWSKTELSNFNK